MVSESTLAIPATRIDVSDLIAFHPSIRVMVGKVHASVDDTSFASTEPAVWLWSTDGRIRPTFVQEGTLEQSLQSAHLQLRKFFCGASRSQREADEAEGGIIIPDYMY
ncbi:MAG TPA: hypothetical protein VFQ54_09960 [Thermomicrobiales bacterium]|nr:hypothetical protein [Thermomicrobiales bacterium]